MSIQNINKREIIEYINRANNIAIFPSKVAGVDAFSAAVGILNALKDKEKKASIVYLGELPEGFENLLDSSDIIDNIGERELLVSIDYSGTDASKVHYSTDEDILYLSVRPVSKDFDLNNIKAQIKGFDFDLIFSIGAQDFDDFGFSYQMIENEFKSAKVINIDNTESNTLFGTINVIDNTVDSVSSIVLNSLGNWELKIGTKAAKALLKGITHKEFKG